MEIQERNRWAEKLFSFLMREMIEPSFNFPGGGLAIKTLSKCLEKLDGGTGKLSREKIVDFCVCQVYTISSFDRDYLGRWKVSHSFGKKAFDRFSKTGMARKYYEDRWLSGKGLSRGALVELFRDRSIHPLAKFIYPENEDRTKRRHTGTEAGLYICSVSTLMWTPFSPVCTNCLKNADCRELTRKRYPELFRIREEEHRKGGVR